jgi:hypothetical protein
MSGELGLSWIWTLMPLVVGSPEFGSSLVVPQLSLLALGAFHGINPGMGWLFAVALGMQERSRDAVLRAMLPLGIGHALAIVFAIVGAMLLGRALPLVYVQWLVGLLLVGFGVSRIVRHRHPRWASMRVGVRGLTWWSFLMATAHGAGLMVVPLFIGLTAAHAHACHSPSHTGSASDALLATGLHSLGYLGVTALIAWFVHEKLGLGLLRRAWLNLDLVWAVALIATGVGTLVV